MSLCEATDSQAITGRPRLASASALFGDANAPQRNAMNCLRFIRSSRQRALEGATARPSTFLTHEKANRHPILHVEIIKLDASFGTGGHRNRPPSKDADGEMAHGAAANILRRATATVNRLRGDRA